MLLSSATNSYWFSWFSNTRHIFLFRMHPNHPTVLFHILSSLTFIQTLLGNLRDETRARKRFFCVIPPVHFLMDTCVTNFQIKLFSRTLTPFYKNQNKWKYWWKFVAIKFVPPHLAVTFNNVRMVRKKKLSKCCTLSTQIVNQYCWKW